MMAYQFHDRVSLRHWAHEGGQAMNRTDLLQETLHGWISLTLLCVCSSMRCATTTYSSTFRVAIS